MACALLRVPRNAALQINRRLRMSSIQLDCWDMATGQHSKRMWGPQVSAFQRLVRFTKTVTLLSFGSTILSIGWIAGRW
jgi:hypothetical protein